MRHMFLGWILTLAVGAGCTAQLQAQDNGEPALLESRLKTLYGANQTGGEIQQAAVFGEDHRDMSADRKFRVSRPDRGGFEEVGELNGREIMQPTPVKSSAPPIPPRRLQSATGTPQLPKRDSHAEPSLARRESSRRITPQPEKAASKAPSAAVAPERIPTSAISQPIEQHAEVWVGDSETAQPIKTQPLQAQPLQAEPLPKQQIQSQPIQSQPIRVAENPSATDSSENAEAEEPIDLEPPKAADQTHTDRVLFARKSPQLSVETLGPRNTVIGKESTFEVHLKNLGEVAADGVTVHIDTPEWAQITAVHPTHGAAQLAADTEDHTLSWRVDRLDARGSEVLTLQIVPRRSDPFDLGVAWSFQPGTSQTLIQVQEPQLDLSISGATEVRYGDTKIYQLIVSNPGTGAAEHVQVQLMPIEGGDDPMAVQEIGTIPAGESKTLEVELTARQAGNITINAMATGELGLKAEASEKVLVRRASLVVDASSPEAKFVDSLTEFKFRVANPGTAPADNLKIVATLPAGAEFVDSSNGGHLNAGSNEVSWSIDTLGAEREIIFFIKANLKSAGENTLSVDATADRELSASGATTTIVESLADLKLEVTDPKGPIPINEEMVYEVRVWNRGTKAAREVEIVTFFSEGVEPLSVKGGSHQINAGQVVFSPIPTLGIGDEVIYKIVARASRSGDHIFRAEVQCSEAHTHLAAEETTHFYDNPTMTARRPAQ